jgi:hypothetical protein
MLTFDPAAPAEQYNRNGGYEAYGQVTAAGRKLPVKRSVWIGCNQSKAASPTLGITAHAMRLNAVLLSPPP